MKEQTLTALARAGYAARGIVYMIIGWLAIESAIGSGGSTTGSKGALRELLAQPGGQIALLAIVVGLFGYAIWRFVQSYFDADEHGTDAKGLAIRAGLMGSAISHVLLAIYAITLLVGTFAGPSDSGNSSAQGWTAELLSQPFGQWLVGIVGAIVLTVGIAHIVKAWKTKFERFLDMTEQQLKIGRPIAIFGLVARGFVFVVIGGFFITAAYKADPDQAKSLGESLAVLQQSAFGPWLFGFVAFGLFAFGLYSCMEAVFRRVGRRSQPAAGGSGAGSSSARGDRLPSRAATGEDHNLLSLDW